MRCMACYENIPAGTETCPCCGFVQYQVIGDTKEALAALEMMAGKHRAMFLKRFDLGVTTYTWKDQDGAIVLDTAKRISFGTADGLMNGPVWLDQQFARIPEKELTVQLSVQKAGELTRVIPVRIPAPQEAQLQQLGVVLEKDLTVRLMLKNGQSQTASQPVAIIAAP